MGLATACLGSIELSMDLPPTSSDLAQSANQVLSEVLVDPPGVLSAMRMCCQSAGCAPWPLGGLLIKLFRLLGEFDGEEGLDAGVEVESFTGPARPDGSCGWMLEAVHRSELIMLRLLAAAQREVKMPGQILITDQPITQLPVGFGEHPTIGIPGDGDTALMNGGVMPLTQQHQLV
jgi:hypothetical protein